jgi:hypothetical protein
MTSVRNSSRTAAPKTPSAPDVRKPAAQIKRPSDTAPAQEGRSLSKSGFNSQLN